MPTPTPSGPLSVAQHKLAQLLAASAAFRVRCGLAAGDADAEAKLLEGQGGTKKVFFPSLERERLLELLPAAVIYFGDQWQWIWESGGQQDYLRPSGSLVLCLADRDRHDGDEEAGGRDFANYAGAVFQDLVGIAGVSDNLSIAAIRQIIAPSRCDDQEKTSLGYAYWLGCWEIEWS